MLFGGAVMRGGNIVWYAKVVWCGSKRSGVVWQ